MKLLDWMQHTFRKTNNDHVPTEFAPRNSCASIGDLQYYPKSHCYAKTQSNTQRPKQFRKSFACIETARADKEQEEQDQLFHGFLAIGTLATNEPPTPTFSTSVEKFTWKETEATEKQLKLINGELEKVLRTEEKKDFANEKPPGGEKKEDGGDICPLQSYLFGSVIGLPETTTGKRASLGELFERTKVEELEKSGPKSNNGEKKSEKSAVSLMKKILKGKTLYPSTRRRSMDSASADKKPGKIQRIFHRKVHPEGPKSDYLTLLPLMDSSKRDAKFCTSDSDGNGECWIQSDTKYLVLEVKGKKDGM